MLLVDKVQDSLGRRSDLAAAVPATGEILWDLEKPVYVEMTSRCDSVLLARGESITGWVLTEAEITNPGEGWMSPFSVPEEGMSEGHPEGAASGSLLCSRVLLHLAATPEAAPRFVRRCAEYAALPR